MLNKRGGWKKFQKLINGEVPIRAWRVEKVSKINKRASLFIRQVRVIIKFALKMCGKMKFFEDTHKKLFKREQSSSSRFM